MYAPARKREGKTIKKEGGGGGSDKFAEVKEVDGARLHIFAKRNGGLPEGVPRPDSREV